MYFHFSLSSPLELGLGPSITTPSAHPKMYVMDRVWMISRKVHCLGVKDFRKYGIFTNIYIKLSHISNLNGPLESRFVLATDLQLALCQVKIGPAILILSILPPFRYFIISPWRGFVCS